MKARDVPPVFWLVGLGLLAVGGVALWVRSRGGVAAAAGEVVGGAARVADQAFSGAVVGAGQVVGIPATDNYQCSADLANGDYWNASFSCPAGRFLSARFGGAEKPVDQTVMDRWDAIAQRGTGAGVAPAQEPYTAEPGGNFWPPATLGYAP